MVVKKNVKRYVKSKGKTTNKYKRYKKQKIYSNVGLYMPKTLFVTLPWTYTYPIPNNLSQGESLDIGIWGNGLTCPLSYNNPVNPETYPMGLIKYSSFYQNYKVMASKITVKISNRSNATYTVALTAASGHNRETTNVNSNYAKLITLSVDDMISYPNTKYKLLSPADSGKGNIRISNFCKTKTILGLKDMSDSIDTQGRMPYTNNTTDSGHNPFGHSTGNNLWFHLLRILPYSTDTIEETDLNVVIHVKYYVQLLGRDVGQHQIVHA